MIPRIEAEPGSVAGDETIDVAPRAPAPGPVNRRLAPQAMASVGSGSGLAAETRDLLQTRLRSVALVFLLGTLAFLVRNLLLRMHDPVLYANFLVLDASLVAIFLWLRPPNSPSLLRLRMVELAIFGLMAAYFVVIHSRFVVILGRAGAAVGLRETLDSVVLVFFSLIATYGMFIPNTPRRTAVVASVLAAVPLVAGSVLWTRHPEIRGPLGGLFTPVWVSGNALMMLIAIATAVAGTAVVQVIRRESFEARRLDQYQLGELLGAGGMGEVYLAEHRLLKRPCALKVIRPGRGGDPGAMTRFEREVRATARLSHPNTIEVYDYGHADDGTFYYVMELLRGLSFEDLVRHGPLPPGRAIFLLRQACAALGEAHASGLIHRDIKPANLFAARRGGLDDFTKLLDFGLVRSLAPGSAELTLDGAIAGSPLFMAPEQAADSAPPDARSDVYSLGAVAYFLLTGRPPLEGPSVLAVLAALARDAPPPPSELSPGIPADLEQVVLRCLAKDPACRYPTAADLDRALASCRSSADWGADRAALWWREIEASRPGISP